MQIAVLDPILRSRELARRAICRLGHVPVTYKSMSELKARSQDFESIGMLLLACPRDPAVFQPLIAQAREILSRERPLILSARKSQFRVISVLHADARSTVVHAPSSFQDTYRILEAALLRRGVPVPERLIEWKGYRFKLDQDSVEFADTPIRLRPREFDLAVAFFRNVDRLLTREWLAENAWGEDAMPTSRMVDVSVSGLRQKLGLQTRLLAIWGQGYQLSGMNELGIGAPTPHSQHTAPRSGAMMSLANSVTT
ncbi:DNA-binding response OmpR family regulator [Variovorax boronicumulans]|uniref:winged helix-turn-helix domain-containing protein n=1 Tax=Variovorax boronicumulans TaxID=436515 RepID=UPI00278448E3|nr:winged helix-turn-helix domain-containing protein [Variovorax boronicumulans]MDQ0086128.1 DNA-binding response OmpR family regulator [Variovorax boronicumulans]